MARFNLTRAPYEAGTQFTCFPGTKVQILTLPPADLADFPHAFVGCARTDAAVIVSHLARLDMMPLMSFAATATEFAGEDVCTYKHTHTHTHTHTPLSGWRVAVLPRVSFYVLFVLGKLKGGKRGEKKIMRVAP